MSDVFLTPRTRHEVIRAPDVWAGGLSVSWAVCSVIAVLYGSLIPFTFDWAAVDIFDALSRFRYGPGASTSEDIITNIVVYVPLGLSIALCGLARVATVSGYLGRLSAALLIGTAVSIIAELIQTGISIRVSSWTDVSCNAIGTAIGAVLGLSLYGVGCNVLGRAKQRVIQRPFNTLAPVLVIGLLCYGLLPFNFVTDTEGLHAAFRRARLDLVSIRAPYPGQPPFEPLTNQMVGMAWFAFLGLVLVRARWEGNRRSANACFSALKHGFLLVFLIEFLQLFTAWHVFDTGTIVLRWLAVGLGVWFALLFAEGRAFGERSAYDGPRRSALSTLLVGVVLFQVVVLLLANIDPTMTSLGNFALDRVRWLPMESLWHRSFGHAVAEIASILVTFGVLTITLVLAMGSRGGRVMWLVAGFATLALATLVEVLQCITPTRIPDTTGPMLALVAVVAASRVIRVLPRVPIYAN